MSGTGAPEAGPVEGASHLRVVVIASQWHTEVMDGLMAGAVRALDDSKVDHRMIIRVPGAFELPVAATRAASSSSVDAVVALGVVIRGGTPHFDYVCQAATDGLTSVAVRTGVPVGFGLLTCDTEQQALDRAGLPSSSEDKGYEAVQAALETAVALLELPKPATAKPDTWRPAR